MRSLINEEKEALGMLQSLRVTCRDCGQPFAFRVTKPSKGKKIHGPVALIEWLCDACFDRWCWEHEPLPPGLAQDPGNEAEETFDE